MMASQDFQFNPSLLPTHQLPVPTQFGNGSVSSPSFGEDSLSLTERVFRKHQELKANNTSPPPLPGPISTTLQKLPASRLPPSLQTQIYGMSDPVDEQNTSPTSSGDTDMSHNLPVAPGPPPARGGGRYNPRYNTRPTSSRGRPLHKRPASSALPPASKKSRTIDKKMDAKLAAGSSCHQCKSRRSLDNLIFCTNIIEKSNKSCRKKYCEHCLRKFYSEEVEKDARHIWVCASCRKICCCAACRRREAKDKEPGFDDPVYESYTKTYSPIQKREIEDDGTADPDYSPSHSQERELPEVPSNGNPSFALLYAVAQMPVVREHIHQILAREDINDGQKVESIASLLRGAVRSNEKAV
eukprot:277209_1